MSVDCASSSAGVRQQQAFVARGGRRHPRRGGNYLWVEVEDPDDEEIAKLADLFGLHELAVEDAAFAHERPKVERCDGFHLSSSTGRPATTTGTTGSSSARSTSRSSSGRSSRVRRT
jgi:Mg2+ and Co2+ transporter CorA